MSAVKITNNALASKLDDEVERAGETFLGIANFIGIDGDGHTDIEFAKEAIQKYLHKFRAFKNVKVIGLQIHDDGDADQPADGSYYTWELEGLPA